MTRRALLKRTSSSDLSEWMAFYVLEAKEYEKARKKAGKK